MRERTNFRENNKLNESISQYNKSVDVILIIDRTYKQEVPLEPT